MITSLIVVRIYLVSAMYFIQEYFSFTFNSISSLDNSKFNQRTLLFQHKKQPWFHAEKFCPGPEMISIWIPHTNSKAKRKMCGITKKNYLRQVTRMSCVFFKVNDEKFENLSNQQLVPFIEGMLIAFLFDKIAINASQFI